MDYYRARCPVIYQGERVGWVLAGGRVSAQANTVHVNLEGTATLFIRSETWSHLAEELDEHGGWVTRADIAVDVFKGDCVDDVRIAYLAGEFDVRGKRPGCDQRGAWPLEHDRTFYVGSRGTGKLFRAYEKGDQLFGHEAGDGWIRYEVELRRTGGRVIENDVLRRPADFFAGCYSFCDQLIERVAGAHGRESTYFDRARDVTDEARAEASVKWARDFAMPTICAIAAFGGDLLDRLFASESWRVPRKLTRMYASGELADQFGKVAARLAPSSAPCAFGAH